MARPKDKNVKVASNSNDQSFAGSSKQTNRSANYAKAKTKFKNATTIAETNDINSARVNSYANMAKLVVSANVGTSNVRTGVYNGIEANCFIRNQVGQHPEDSQLGSLEVTADIAARATASAAVLWNTHWFGANAARATSMSAINQSSYRIKQFIDTNLGTDATFQAQDIAVYLMAVSDIVEKITEIKRAIRIGWTAPTAYPSFVPHGMYEALKLSLPASQQNEWSPKEWKTDPTEVRAFYSRNAKPLADRLNALIDDFNGLPIPAELPLFTVNDDLYENVYLDHPNAENAQMFLFASNGYWVYDEESYSKGAAIRFEHWGVNFGKPDSKVKSIEDMIGAVQHCIAKVRHATESSGMMAKLYNAYGTDMRLHLDHLQPDTIIPIIYDEQMLISIENTAIVHAVEYSDIVADTKQGVTGAPLVPYADDNVGAAINLPLQFHCDAFGVTQEMVAAALRFHPVFYNHANWPQNLGGESKFRDSLSSEGLYGFAIVNQLDIVMYNTVNNQDDSFTFKTYTIRNRNQSTSFEIANMLSDFNAAPMLTHYNLTSEGDGVNCRKTIQLLSYTGQRDTERTIPLVELEQWFRGMCEIAWSSNMNRSTKSQRGIVG